MSRRAICVTVSPSYRPKSSGRPGVFAAYGLPAAAGAAVVKTMPPPPSAQLAVVGLRAARRCGPCHRRRSAPSCAARWRTSRIRRPGGTAPPGRGRRPGSPAARPGDGPAAPRRRRGRQSSVPMIGRAGQSEGAVPAATRLPHRRRRPEAATGSRTGNGLDSDERCRDTSTTWPEATGPPKARPWHLRTSAGMTSGVPMSEAQSSGILIQPWRIA